MPRHATKTSFKKGRLHKRWKGGCEDYWHIEARKKVNCQKGMIVHHIDNDVKNNSITNLQIMTQSEHCSLHNKQRRGKKRYDCIKYQIKKKVDKLTKQGYTSREIAKILGVGKTTVLRSRKMMGDVNE